MKKFYIKLKICYFIISGKYQHWFIINLTRDNLIKLFKKEEFIIQTECCGVRDYVVFKTLKSMGDAISDEELEISRIEFEVNASIK